MFALLGLLFIGVVVFLMVTALAVVVKVAIRLILLPLFLLKWLISGVVLMIVGPVIALVGLVLLLVAGVVFVVPLLPLIALGAIVWLLVRATRRPALV